MIAITRAIESISVNGKEWLISNEGDILKFKDEMSAINFF
jgi:hypothetical protein